MAKKAIYVFTFCFITVSLAYTLLNPYQTAYYACSAIKMCASSLVPTLFAFMVFSRMLSHLCTSNLFNGKLTNRLSRIFNLPSRLIPICISGLFCGAPSGAFAICRLYDEGHCTESEAKRACILGNNCSAAFILGFISALLGNRAAGIYIFLSNIAATLFVYFIFYRDTKHKTTSTVALSDTKQSPFEIITDSISSSVTSTVVLCGYVIFFYTFTQVLCENLVPLLNGLSLTAKQAAFINAAAASLFEISSGVLRIGELGGTESIVMCAGAAAFTGISMLLQVADILGKSGISSKEYIVSKCLCAFVSPIFVTVFMLLSPKSVSVSAPQAAKAVSGISVSDVIFLVFAVCIVFAGAHLLSYLEKKHKK